MTSYPVKAASVGNPWWTLMLGIHSPSRVIRDQVGKFIPLGLVDGIMGQKSEVDKALESLVDTSRMSTAIEDVNADLQRSSRFSVEANSKLEMQQSNKPAVFNIHLGKQKFEAFVDDISNVQGAKVDLNMEF